MVLLDILHGATITPQGLWNYIKGLRHRKVYIRSLFKRGAPYVRHVDSNERETTADSKRPV